MLKRFLFSFVMVSMAAQVSMAADPDLKNALLYEDLIKILEPSFRENCNDSGWTELHPNPKNEYYCRTTGKLDLFIHLIKSPNSTRAGEMVQINVLVRKNDPDMKAVADLIRKALKNARWKVEITEPYRPKNATAGIGVGPEHISLSSGQNGNIVEFLNQLVELND